MSDFVLAILAVITFVMGVVVGYTFKGTSNDDGPFGNLI